MSATKQWKWLLGSVATVIIVEPDEDILIHILKQMDQLGQLRCWFIVTSYHSESSS